MHRDKKNSAAILTPLSDRRELFARPLFISSPALEVDIYAASDA